MANAPDRFERFVLPDGVPKCAPDCWDTRRRPRAERGQRRVSVTPDTKVKNAATFRIEREDHTVGNTVTLCARSAPVSSWGGRTAHSPCALARRQLHRDPEVLFAGYRVPHPMEYHTILRVSGAGAGPTGEAPARPERHARTRAGADQGRAGQEGQDPAAGVQGRADGPGERVPGHAHPVRGRRPCCPCHVALRERALSPGRAQVATRDMDTNAVPPPAPLPPPALPAP